MANSNMAMILNKYFQVYSNVNILFAVQKLTWRLYILVKALSINKQIEIFNKIKFTKVVLVKDFETFLVYIAALKAFLASIVIYLF